LNLEPWLRFEFGRNKIRKEKKKKKIEKGKEELCVRA
jgi:hypothetical protein